MQHFDLSSNQLSGGIPSGITNLTALQYLNFASNQLTGIIPSGIGSLTALTYFDLDTNRLSGTIPSSVGSLSQLTDLWLQYNALTGSIPPEIGNVGNDPVTGNHNLGTLYLNNNQLSGDIPTSIGDLSGLTHLWLQFNSLAGSIPSEIGNVGYDPVTGNHLGLLYLNNNQLSGTIPSTIGNLTNLTGLWLNSNQLTGAIPTQIGNLTGLTQLRLDANHLTGGIPAEIGALTALNWLDLEINQLTSIPPEIGALTALQWLDLDSNQIAGTIPTQIGSLTALQNIFLNGNMLTGPIPASLMSLSNLAAGGSDIRFNALYVNTGDPAIDHALSNFLNSMQTGGDWSDFQTVTPANFKVTATSSTSATVSWDPIDYTTDPGGYQLSGIIDGVIDVPGKTSSFYTATNLNIGQAYSATISAYTSPNSNNANLVVSQPSAPPVNIQLFYITANAGEYGSISPSGQVSVNNGANQAFSITPAPNCYIAGVTVDTVVQDPSTYSSGTYTFTNVTASHAISATFASNTAPGAPTAVSATGGWQRATVNFTAPTSTGGSPITYYTVTSNPGSITATGTGSPITVTGLTNGITYTFTVTATNAVGTGPASYPASNQVTPGYGPGAPTGVTATAGNAQASVSFLAPSSNGGSAITGYTVTSNPGGITATGTGSPLTVSPLTNGTAYTFTVTATNANGTGQPSAASNSVTPAGPPGAPTIGTVTAGNAQATVIFTPTPPASNGGSAILYYTVTSSPGNITATGAGSPIIVTGLTNGTAYTLTLTATNALGTSPGVSSSVTPYTVPGPRQGPAQRPATPRRRSLSRPPRQPAAAP